MPIRILIADDHGVLRAGLHALLNAEPGLEVVGEAADGEEALRLCSLLAPNVVLMDISMGGSGGIDTTHLLKDRYPLVSVLILTVHEDKELLQAAIRAGASGYILKSAVKSELINAIHAAASGGLYVHPSLTRALISDGKKPRPDPRDEPDTLTQRELEILRWIVKGYTNSQVAEELNISVRTVEYHRGNLMDKLNLHSRVGLVRYAAEHGLL
jgi:two-component system response regulator NreC